MRGLFGLARFGPLRRNTEASVLGALSLISLFCILVAGMWPFGASKNGVEWLPGVSGLKFGPHGTVTSSQRATRVSPEWGVPCSLEIWLKGALVNSSSTIFVFYRPDSSQHLSIRQSISDLLLQTGNGRLYVDELFKDKKDLFITLTSDTKDVRVFVNGHLKRKASTAVMPCDALGGLITIGTSLTQDDSWEGELLGLALYGSALSSEDVAEHYQTWIGPAHQPKIGPKDRSVALYLFREGRGRILHSDVPRGEDLQIPSKFQLFHQTFLAAPWCGFHSGWGYLKDLLINILGFLPLGFFLCAWVNQYIGRGRAVTLTLIFGLAISITIEILQSHLPTRHSDVTDVLTNTLGVSVGAAVYAETPLRVMVHNMLKSAPARNEQRDA